MLKNTSKATRKENLYRFQNGLAKPKNGEMFELIVADYYQASRVYQSTPASRAGDMVAKGTHYQIKAYNGFWENISNLEEFETFITKICKAERYILRVGTDSGFEGFIGWLDVDKSEIIELAKQGYIKFNRLAHGRTAAKWGITRKQARNNFSKKQVIIQR